MAAIENHHKGFRRRAYVVAIERERHADAEPSNPGRVIGLVSEERHNDLWPAGTQRLSRGADAAMMDNAESAGKQKRVRCLSTDMRVRSG
jgi:hypothetical protein